MKRTALLMAVGVTVLLALVVGAALATPPKDATVTPLTRATLGKFEANNDGIDVESEQRSADIAIAKVVLKPGGSTGWHSHPGVTLVSVASGTVAGYDNKCEKTVYKAGEGFADLASNGAGHVVRNKGNEKAVLYATFLVPTNTTDEGLRIDEPKPRNCNVR
jgi:quercetin dioxygenase-like cupin family protein